MLCGCCGDVAERPSTATLPVGGGRGRQQPAAPHKQAAAATARLIEDLDAGEAKLPTFNWRFRDGFGSVPIGVAGAVKFAEAMKTSKTMCCEVLELQNQQIGDEGCAELATALATNRTVRQLLLSKNRITKLGAVALAASLIENSAITRLVFEDNPIGSAGVAEVAIGALQSTSIRQLEIGAAPNQLLEDEAVVALADLIKKPTLTRIRVTGQDTVTPASLTTMMGAFATLPPNSELAEVVFANCVPAEAAVSQQAAISSAMAQLAKCLRAPTCPITLLELKIPLGDNGASVLARGLPNASSLKVLNLARCGIGAHGIIEIAEGLKGNAGIEKVDLSLQGDEIRAAGATGASAVMSLAKVAEIHGSLTDLNVADLPMTAEVAAAFIAALSNPTCVLRSLRHSQVPSDELATRLSTLLSEKERHAAAVAAAVKRRSPASSTISTPRSAAFPPPSPARELPSPSQQLQPAARQVQQQNALLSLIPAVAPTVDPEAEGADEEMVEIEF